MISGSREADLSTKQDQNIKTTTTKASSSSSTPWLKQRDPRIVRVSRTFGGKDRHSKVCTIRGLRDRRVRLSVPTAIQLYDLQDRLGLNQPSKVVDWLLNVAKDEIDELPPLQMPPSGNFLQTHHSILASQQEAAAQPDQDRSKINHIIDLEDPFGLPRSNSWMSNNSHLTSKSKEVAEEKEDWNTKRNELSNFFPRANNQSSLPNFLNSSLPYGSFYHLEPSNYSLSQFGSSQAEDFHNFNVVPLQSTATLSVPSGSHVYVCPPPATTSTTQSYFQSHVSASPECNPRQINYFPSSSSVMHNNPLSNSLTSPPSYHISQLMRPNFSLSMAPTQNDEDDRQPNKDSEFPSK